MIKWLYICGVWKRRDGRVVDCGGLENRWTARFRGFESLSLRQTTKAENRSMSGFFIADSAANLFAKQLTEIKRNNLLFRLLPFAQPPPQGKNERRDAVAEWSEVNPICQYRYSKRQKSFCRFLFGHRSPLQTMFAGLIDQTKSLCDSRCRI